MPFLELFDETLDINSTENYELSIQISSAELSFCILDKLKNKYILIRSHEPEEGKYFITDNLIDIINKDDFLTKRYKKIHILTPSPKFTLVPTALYDSGKKEEYFMFNHVREDNNVILSNKIPDPDAYLIFSLQKAIDDLLNSIYPEVQHLHHLQPLFRHISQSRKDVNRYYLHVHVERDFFNLIIFDYHKLEFCNTFKYRNSSDILYYVLNVFKRIDIYQDETIFFSGRTELHNDLTSSFSIYIRNVKFAEPLGTYTFSYVFNNQELHRFLNLFSVINCE